MVGYERLKRNLYYDVPADYAYPTTGKDHYNDQQDFLLPLARMQAAHLHDAGVAAGLEVDGTVGASLVSIRSGVAVDVSGQLISLAPNGHANTGTPASPTEVTVPVSLGFSGRTGQTLYLTIQFAELLRATEGPGGRWEQVP